MTATPVRCPKCAFEMLLKRRLRFATGPTKLIYVCVMNENHVRIEDEPRSREAVASGD